MVLQTSVSQLKLTLLSLAIYVHQTWSTSVREHLDQGTQLLRTGNLGEALNHYHAAVEGDAKNYLAYYQRATVFLALGRHKQALSDFDTVIRLKPDFHHAKSERGTVLMKQGKVEDARAQFTELLNADPEKAQAGLSDLPVLEQAIEDGDEYFENSDFATAIDHYDHAIDIAKWDTSLREKRAEAYLKIGNIINAIGDVRAIAKLTNDNTNAYLKLAQLHYIMGEEEESLKEIRECLKLDQDHKDCHTHYKKVKKLVKQLNQAQDFINEGVYGEAVSKLKAALKTESSEEKIVLKIQSRLCLCNKQGGFVEDCLSTCTTVLERESQDIEALVNRAECLILNEDFEGAIKDYQTAQGIHTDSKHIKEGLHRAEKLLKQSKKRDYYKILGVPRNAEKSQINKAYRKLAKEFHPDKYTDEADKAEAEKKFIDIAAAKEVLTDDEKRQQFDNGEDPLDPETEQGKNFHQHFHGGFPFGGGGGGGGQQFHFKFQ